MTKDWRPKEKRLTKPKKIKKNVRFFIPQSTSALASPPLSSSPASSARSSSSQSSSSSTTSSYSLTSSASSASSSSSSTSSTTKPAESSDLTKSRQRLALENLHKFLRADVEVSSDEEEEEEQEAECAEDFFETFQELPDIQDISIEIEEIKPKDISGHNGQFVDPLKDLQLYHPSPVVETEKETVEEAKPAPSKKSSTSESDSLKTDFDDLLTTADYSTGGTDTLDSEPTKVIAKPEDLFHNLLEFTIETVEEEEVTEEDWGAAWDTVWAREREAEQLKRDALEFLDDIILMVVKIDRSVTARLREKLDKRKLLVELAEKYEQFQLESQDLELLQRKVARHMKRKKSSSSLESDDITELTANKSRYEENFLLLEKQLAREAATIKKSQATKDILLKEYKECEQKTANQIRAFEKLVRTTLARPPHHVNLLIEQPLQELAKYRKEVSDVRLQLILKHQSYIELKKKIHNLEDLGDGLTAKSYFHMLDQTKELEADIKERNIELKKLHSSTQRSIHMLAHCKEMQNKLQSTVVQQHRKLNELHARRKGLRGRVQELTQRRMRIQAQLNDVRLRAGLLDKPLLLKDYDETVERIKQQRENNANLRATMLAIEAKIQRFEKILADNSAKTMILY